MILTKLGQQVNEMMAVAVKKFHSNKVFYWSRFLIIRQNVNMATNAILHCRLTSSVQLIQFRVLSCCRLLDSQLTKSR